MISVRKGAPHYLQNVRSKLHDTFTSNMNYKTNGKAKKMWQLFTSLTVLHQSESFLHHHSPQIRFDCTIELHINLTQGSLGRESVCDYLECLTGIDVFDNITFLSQIAPNPSTASVIGAPLPVMFN